MSRGWPEFEQSAVRLADPLVAVLKPHTVLYARAYTYHESAPPTAHAMNAHTLFYEHPLAAAYPFDCDVQLSVWRSPDRPVVLRDARLASRLTLAALTALGARTDDPPGLHWAAGPAERAARLPAVLAFAASTWVSGLELDGYTAAWGSDDAPDTAGTVDEPQPGGAPTYVFNEPAALLQRSTRRPCLDVRCSAEQTAGTEWGSCESVFTASGAVGVRPVWSALGSHCPELGPPMKALAARRAADAWNEYVVEEYLAVMKRLGYDQKTALAMVPSAGTAHTPCVVDAGTPARLLPADAHWVMNHIPDPPWVAQQDASNAAHAAVQFK